MKRHLRELSPTDRKTWRQWKAWSICIYTLIIAVLLGIESLVSRSGDAGRSHSASISQDSWSKQTVVSARAGSN